MSLAEMHTQVSRRIGKKLEHFCSPLVDRFGANHFYHYMLTDSGQFASVGSNEEWHERLYFGSEGYGYRCLPYIRHTKNLYGGVFFTQATHDENWKQMAELANRDFDVHFGLQLIVQTHEGLEGFGFALDTQDPFRHMVFFNALSEIKLFINEYRKEFQTTLLKDNLTDVATLIGPAFYDASKLELPDEERRFLKKLQIELPAPFSKREVNVIRETLNGYSAPEIAETLFISKRTVEHHLERIKDKLDCNSKSDLIQKLRDLEAMGYRF